MGLVRLPYPFLWMLGLGLFGACARGTLSDDAGEDGSSSGNGASGATGGTSANGGSSSTATSTASTGAAATGGVGGVGGNGCGPPEHLCNGNCEGNTPQTGCYQSSTCTSCPSVPNGLATCTSNGLCDFTCTPPYQKSGNTCACVTQCCTNQDCTSPNTCQSGQCVCDNTLCQSQCMMIMCLGQCFANTCQCTICI